MCHFHDKSQTYLYHFYILFKVHSSFIFTFKVHSFILYILFLRNISQYLGIKNKTAAFVFLIKLLFFVISKFNPVHTNFKK